MYRNTLNWSEENGDVNSSEFSFYFQRGGGEIDEVLW